VQELIEADFVIVPSRFARDSLLAEGVPPRKLIEVPFGVDLQHFVPAPDRPEVPFRAIFVGQVSLRKGVPDLLEAWRSLGWRDSELWVVGRLDADMRRLWPRWAQLAGLRHIPHTADVATLLRQAHVFVFPSLEEGSALVTYEALASGLPVIATANAGSVVQDRVQGFIVEAQNPQALGARLDQIRADACLRRAMGAAARRLVEGYPWAGYGQRLLEAYRQMTMAA
jgi:glycosyltransferase involved in cell wall biosynthesis